MPDYNWPPPEKRKYIGKRISRVDGPAKSTGRARYTYDYNPKGLLWGAILRSGGFRLATSAFRFRSFVAIRLC